MDRHVHPTLHGPTSKPITSEASPGRHFHGTWQGPSSLDEPEPDGGHTHKMPNGSWKLDKPMLAEVLS